MVTTATGKGMCPWRRIAIHNGLKLKQKLWSITVDCKSTELSVRKSRAPGQT